MLAEGLPRERCFLRRPGANCASIPADFQQRVKPPIKHSGQPVTPEAQTSREITPNHCALGPRTLRPVGVLRPDPLKRYSHLHVEIKFHSPGHFGLQRWYLARSLSPPRMRGKLRSGFVPQDGPTLPRRRWQAVSHPCSPVPGLGFSSIELELPLSVSSIIVDIASFFPIPASSAARRGAKGESGSHVRVIVTRNHIRRPSLSTTLISSNISNSEHREPGAAIHFDVARRQTEPNFSHSFVLLVRTRGSRAASCARALQSLFYRLLAVAHSRFRAFQLDLHPGFAASVSKIDGIAFLSRAEDRPRPQYRVSVL